MDKFYKLIKPLFVLLICFFIFPIVSKAVECSAELESKYISMARNINISYIVKDDDKGNPKFDIIFNNFFDKIRVVSDNNPEEEGILTGTQNGDIGYTASYTVTKPGVYKYKIYVMPNGQNGCVINTNVRLSVKIPAYNKFYKDERCNGYTKYELCKKWSGYSGDEKKFANDLEEIKKKEEAERNKVVEEPPKPNKKWYKNISQIFVKYWWFFTAIIVIIIGVYYLIRQKQKKNEYNFKL